MGVVSQYLFCRRVRPTAGLDTLYTSLFPLAGTDSLIFRILRVPPFVHPVTYGGKCACPGVMTQTHVTADELRTAHKMKALVKATLRTVDHKGTEELER